MSINIESPEAPRELWKIFNEITNVPRPSKHEEKIRSYIIDLAKKNNCEYLEDKIGNILIKVPAAKGLEALPKVAIQNHIDMVTDAISGKVIDFKNDPIETYVDGEWGKARGTTLGADNGIGCAASLALMTSSDIEHPELELLFTVDEETGLTGALELDSSLVTAKTVLNLDTEEWGSVYVGCAGGADFEFNKSYELESLTDNQCVLDLKLEKLSGGHSGVDIHRYRMNAIKGMTQILQGLKAFNPRLISFKAGKAHNIIPRDCEVSFSCAQNDVEKVAKVVDSITDDWKTYLTVEDQNFEISLSEGAKANSSLSVNDSKELISFLNFFPDGVNTFVRQENDSTEPLVATSNNLALLVLNENKAYALTSMRFFNRKEANELEDKFYNLSEVFNFKVQKNSEYPSWNPDFKNPLLKKASQVYKEMFKEDVEVKAIHAGLECGILIDRLGEDTKALSFGPTIINAHSPDESVHIPSVTLFWNFLVKLLKNLH